MDALTGIDISSGMLRRAAQRVASDPGLQGAQVSLKQVCGRSTRRKRGDSDADRTKAARLLSQTLSVVIAKISLVCYCRAG